MGLGTIMRKHLTEKILTNRNKTPFGSRPVLARKYPPSRAAPSPRYPLKQCQEQWRPAVGTWSSDYFDDDDGFWCSKVLRMEFREKTRVPRSMFDEWML